MKNFQFHIVKLPFFDVKTYEKLTFFIVFLDWQQSCLIMQKVQKGKILKKGLEILIAVVFCKECVLPVQWWFLFCKGGEDGRGTDGGGGRTKTRIARPKHIIKSCVKMHMNSNIHNEFPAPLIKRGIYDFFNFQSLEKKGYSFDHNCILHSFIM